MIKNKNQKKTKKKTNKHCNESNESIERLIYHISKTYFNCIINT